MADQEETAAPEAPADDAPADDAQADPAEVKPAAQAAPAGPAQVTISQKGPEGMGLLMPAMVICAVALFAVYFATKPSPDDTTQKQSTFEPIERLGEPESPAPSASQPAAPQPAAGSPPAGSPAPVAAAKGYRFNEAGFVAEVPTRLELKQQIDGLVVQIAGAIDRKPVMTLISGPAYPWMTPESISAFVKGTLHEGGRVKMGGFSFGSPATAWVELKDGFVLLTRERLFMVTLPGGARPEVVHMFNSIKFLRVKSVRAHYGSVLKLSPAQANAPADLELVRKMEEDLAALEAITLPLPIPMKSGIEAYKKGGMNTLDLMILRDILKPAVEAGKGHQEGRKKPPGDSTQKKNPR